MFEEPDNQIHFNTQLPQIHDSDTVVKSQTYIDFLYDSLNPRPEDSTFIFLPNENVVSVTDTSQVLEIKPSIIVPHKTKPVQIIPKERETANYDWLTGLFIVCMVVLVWVRYEAERRVSALFKGVFAKHNMNQMLRDGDIIHERFTTGLMFIYFVSLSALLMLLISKYLHSYLWTDNSFILFSGLITSLLILWIVKILIIRTIGKIFRTKSETDEYIITNIIYNIAIGLVIFPFIFAGYFAGYETSTYIAIGIFIIGFVLKFIRSIFVGLSVQTFPVVYLFLYLCTLEILPFLVIYKIIAG
jgi:hypothetical protein